MADRPKVHPLPMLLLREAEQSRDLEGSSCLEQPSDLEQSSVIQQSSKPEQSHDTDKPKIHPLRMLLLPEYLTKLPEELLVMIASNLNGFNNKQFRLTSRVCCRAATPRVFQEITLRMQRDSIQNFLNIASDDQLCQHPQTIIFEFGETRRIFTNHKSFGKSLYQPKFGSNPRFPRLSRTTTERHNFSSDAEIRMLYKSYQEDSRAASEFMRGLTSDNIPGRFMELAPDMMLNAIPRLTNLENFIMSDEIFRSSMFTWRWLWLDSAEWNQHLFLRSDAYRQLSGILSVLSMNKHLKRLSMRTYGRAFWVDKYHHVGQAFPRILDIANEELERLTTEAPIQLISSAFRHLSSLHILMTVEISDHPLIMRGVGDLLHDLQNIKVLSILFETNFPVMPDDFFRDDEKCLLERLSEANLPHLEYISLRNVVTSEEHLLGFFAGVSSTLRVLIMDCIQILSGRGSWESTLPELPNTLKALKEVDITTLVDGDLEEGFNPASWHFINDEDMAAGVLRRREPSLKLEQPQHREFLVNAYLHYEAEMEDFLLRRSPQNPMLQICQVDYMAEHPNFCKWCRLHSDDWQYRKMSIREEHATLNKDLGMTSEMKALEEEFEDDSSDGGD